MSEPDHLTGRPEKNLQKHSVTAFNSSADVEYPRDLVDQAQAYARKARSERTVTEYQKDWNHFTQFCAELNQTPMPASSETVALWITSMADAGRKPSTIQRRLAAVASAHHAQGHNAPTRTPLVREILKGITRTAAQQAADNGQRSVTCHAQTMTSRQLYDTVKAINGDLPIDHRDRALLLIGFAGYFRRSELAAITIEQIEPTNDGIRIHLPKSKADQHGHGTWRDIHHGSHPPSGPVAALTNWTTTAALTTGPVFRPIDRHNNIANRALSDRAIYNIIQKRGNAAGHPGMGGHSLRRGAATTAAQLGAAQLEIARAGGWADNSQTVARYVDISTTKTPNLGL